MKWFVRLIVLAAAVGGGYWVWTHRAPGTTVEASAVFVGPIREYVDEEGKTRLPRTHQITMPYNGRIAAIDFPEGTAVSQGQVVAQIVERDLTLELNAAQAAVDRLNASIIENDDTSVEETGLKQSLSYVTSMDLTVEAAGNRERSGKSRYEFFKSQLGRVRTLRESKAVTEDQVNKSEMELVESDVDYQQDILVHRALEALQTATALLPTAIRQYIARKDLTRAVLEQERAQAEVKLQQVVSQKERGTMTSPVNGVVLSQPVQNEQQLSAGTVLLEIGRLEELEVEADLLSQEVVDVQVDDAVEFYGPAIGHQPAQGKVVRIFPAGFTKISSLGVEQQRVKVIMQLEPDASAELRRQRGLGIGYRVQVRIYTAEKPQAPLIKRSALFRGAGGDWQVFAVRDQRAWLTPITVGLMNDDVVEVTGGLKPGDLVVLAPESSLTHGARVQPVVQSAPTPLAAPLAPSATTSPAAVPAETGNSAAPDGARHGTENSTPGNSSPASSSPTEPPSNQNQ